MPRPAGSHPTSPLLSADAQPITLRDTAPADHAFVRKLHFDLRPELAAVDLPPAAVGQLLDLQIAAQTAQYHASYPAAQDQLICLATEPVGRCWMHQGDSELRILDLAVLSTHRRRGIGRAVLSALCRRAERAKLPLRLQVWHANAPAQRLYTRIGFRGHGQAGGYLAMEWTAASPVKPIEQTVCHHTDERGRHV